MSASLAAFMRDFPPARPTKRNVNGGRKIERTRLTTARTSCVVLSCFKTNLKTALMILSTLPPIATPKIPPSAVKIKDHAGKNTKVKKQARSNERQKKTSNRCFLAKDSISFTETPSLSLFGFMVSFLELLFPQKTLCFKSFTSVM